MPASETKAYWRHSQHYVFTMASLNKRNKRYVNFCEEGKMGGLYAENSYVNMRCKGM